MDWEIRLNPLSKLHIYQVARKIIFRKMDADLITPERADAILTDVEKDAVKIEIPEQAKLYYHILANKYPELKEIEQEFGREYGEKLDQVIKKLVENIVEKGDLELAAKIMDEVEDLNEKNKNISQIAENYPDEFNKALLTITN